MSIAVVDRIGRTLLMITGGTVAVVVALAASLSVMVLSVGHVSPASPAWTGLVLVVLTTLSLAAPDGFTGLVTLLGYAGWWLVVAEDAALGWTLAAAVALLVFHLALAHAAAAPGGAGSDPRATWSLLAGAGVVVAATAALTVVVAGAEGAFRTPATVVGIALVLLGLLPWLGSIAGIRD